MGRVYWTWLDPSKTEAQYQPSVFRRGRLNQRENQRERERERWRKKMREESQTRRRRRWWLRYLPTKKSSKAHSQSQPHLLSSLLLKAFPKLFLLSNPLNSTLLHLLHNLLRFRRPLFPGTPFAHFYPNPINKVLFAFIIIIILFLWASFESVYYIEFGFCDIKFVGGFWSFSVDENYSLLIRDYKVFTGSAQWLRKPSKYWLKIKTKPWLNCVLWLEANRDILLVSANGRFWH